MNNPENERRPFLRGDFSAVEFSQRRQALLEVIGTDAVAVVPGAVASGAFDVFRQSNEFYYLTGIEVPQAYLFLDGRNGLTTIYLPSPDSRLERSEGAVVNCDDVALIKTAAGVDHVRELAALEHDLGAAVDIWLPLQPAECRQMCRDVTRHGRRLREADPWDRNETREDLFFQAVKRVCPRADLHDLCPILDQLREIKSDTEVSLMREAGRLTGMAVRHAMEATRPGLLEFQLAAIAEQAYLDGGAFGGAYRPIVAAGINIWNAHYFRNNCPLVDGQLVLMDYAPDYRYYTSDIGRMWPVNGRYSDQQRELYGFMVDYHKVLLEHIRPGVLATQVMQEAAEKMRGVVESTCWSCELFREAARDVLTFDGHLSHGVGMSVHDVGDYRRVPLREGVVFALDPQMWVQEMQLYVRVEDTIAVTADGVEVLTQLAPLELARVEQTIAADQA